MMKIKAVIYEAEEGGYWAKVPSLPGVYTQAETLEELEANLREAIEVYLADESAADAAAAQENGRVLEIAV
jgi:predicted RNase H-like HicB family nuclease